MDVWCVVFISILTLVFADCHDTDQHMSPHEKVLYHYDQLLHAVMDIKKTSVEDQQDLPTTLIAAGDGSSLDENHQSDDVSTLILRSVQASCPLTQTSGTGNETIINVFNTTIINFSLRPKKKKSKKSSLKDQRPNGPMTDCQLCQRRKKKSSEDLAKWVKNLVRPIKFTLKREGQLARVTFDVLRTEPAVVSRTWTFYGERKYLEGPANLDAGLAITTPIDFVFNISDCSPMSPLLHARREYFTFSKRSSNLDEVLLTMPTCLLDFVDNVPANSEKEHQLKRKNGSYQYTQKLSYPKHLNGLDISKIQNSEKEHQLKRKNGSYQYTQKLSYPKHLNELNISKIQNSEKEHQLKRKNGSYQYTQKLSYPKHLNELNISKIQNSEKEHQLKRKNGSYQYTQKLSYPKHLNELDISKIQTVVGENATLYFHAALGEGDHFIVRGSFYNASSGSMFNSNVLYLRPSNGNETFQSLDGEQRVKLIDGYVYSREYIYGSVPGIDYMTSNSDTVLHHRSVYLEINLKTANENVSGMLQFQYTSKIPVRGQVDSSTRLSVTSTVVKGIQILSPSSNGALPKGKYLPNRHQKFQCGHDEGFSRSHGHGDNCTFFCLVQGTGIKRMRVKQFLGGGRTPVQKYTEVNSYNALLMANLGPTRRDLDGKYECRAIEIGGKRHRWTVTVRTWGFPVINLNETTLQLHNNATATFVCVVSSKRPVNVTASVLAGREARRIDDDINVTRRLRKRSNETRMEVTLPTTYLRWPNEFLACEADSEAGSDKSMQSLDKDKVHDYYRETAHPFLLRGESLVTDHRDGFATVKCVATGKGPLEIKFIIDPLTNQEIIGKFYYTYRSIFTTQRDGDKTTKILKIRTALLKKPRSIISCRAKNEYGEDWIYFELANFIHDF